MDITLANYHDCFAETILWPSNPQILLSDTHEFNNIYNTQLQHIISLKSSPNQSQWNDYWSKATNTPSWVTHKHNDNFLYMWKDYFVQTRTHIQDVYYRHYVIPGVLSTVDVLRTKNILEFGCGNGYTLDALYTHGYTRQQLYGLDFSSAAIYNIKKKGYSGEFFNMYTDSLTQDLVDYVRGGIVLTSGSMEQLGVNWQHILNVFLTLDAEYYIHIEPILEFYKFTNPVDNLAMMFHVQKQYLTGYYAFLQNHPQVKIICTVPSQFGDKNNKGFSIVIWQKYNLAL